MLVNQIISTTDISDESGGPIEPVTLPEVKEKLRIGGSEVSYDDAALTDMITEARMWVEKYTGLHVIPKTISVVARNEAGMLQLPGPVRGSVVLTDYLGVEVASDTYTVLGTSIISTTFCNRITAVYEAGYAPGEAPRWVKNAIFAYIAWFYENIGDEATASPVTAAAICRPHRRVAAWA